MKRLAAALFASALLWVQPVSAQEARDAEPRVVDEQNRLRATLPFADRQDFADARRGFVASLPEIEIKNAAGQVVWTLKPYGFLSAEDGPATVNPSLWRNARLNMAHGLFKVTERLYQIRGFDISNMTVVEGDTGLIVIDPLISTEVAKAGLDLYYAHRPRKPVIAVVYTHSHVDHFGGVKGVVSEDEVRAGRVKIYAPDGFMEHAVSENVIAGTAMSRRAQFQFGIFLPPGPRGQVDAGIGKALSRGTITLIPPTVLVKGQIERHTVDGVEIVFQLTPETEAPSEMNLFFPGLRALNLAENAVHTLHNLYPLRGAQVRDANGWAKYLNQALHLFAGQADVVLAQHQWPMWDTARLADYLKKQRDLYKFLHDQTLRLMNKGYTAPEIAERLRPPASLAAAWHTRGYYGTVRHSVRAIYQRYLGWYDGNPANLDPLPPIEAAKKYIDYMGGAEAVLARARADFAKGEFRWVASVMNHVVFADPANRAARLLGADALEQLGYLAESATWRNAYLTGAMELRRGVPDQAMGVSASADLVRALPVEMFFDLMAIRVDAAKAEGRRIALNWRIEGEKPYLLQLENSALSYMADRQSAAADATITLPRPVLDAIMLRRTTFPRAVAEGQARIEGNPLKLIELFGLLDDFDARFAVIEPKR